MDAPSMTCGASRWRRVAWPDTESVGPGGVEAFVAVGGTIVQASLVAARVQRGVFGSAKSAQNPISVNLRGEENLKADAIYQQHTIAKFIRSQTLRLLGEEFRELRPEQESFPTLAFNLRLLMDDGNHVQAFLLAGLAALYLHVNYLRAQEDFEPESLAEPIDYYFPLSVILVDQECSFDSPDIFCDPSWEEEQVSKNWILFIQKIASGSYCVYKPGGETVSLELIDSLKRINQGKGAEIAKFKKFLEDKLTISVTIF